MTIPPTYPQLEDNAPLLLGPGPSNVPPRVLQAMAAPMMGHLDPVFLETMDRIQDLLRYTFQTENSVAIPVSGTGSAAMEAALSNMIEPGDPVLVFVKGFFGERIEEMSRRYRGEVETIRKPLGEVFSLEEIEQALEAHPAKVVAIVHGETSSGAQQPMEGIADLVHAKGGLLIVDAVATLGGSPVLVDEWDLDVCYSGSQKGLSCPPGLGPITLGPRAQEALAKRTTPVGNWYFDMSGLEHYWGKERTYHHTAPISSNLALYEGLRIVAEEGLEARWARHQASAEMLWEGLQGLDMTMVVPEPNRMITVTTVRVPEGVDEAAVRAQLRAEYNIAIAGGLGDMKGKVWRIGLMGYSARKQNVRRLIGALDRILHG
ncbi:MAG: pyridoxal-phosphate-dependent aminotransferase family protein [Anaerolineales bacterium]